MHQNSEFSAIKYFKLFDSFVEDIFAQAKTTQQTAVKFSETINIALQVAKIRLDPIVHMDLLNHVTHVMRNR